MRAAIKFGETTDSFDADGELVSSLPVLPMTVEELNEAAAAFQGDQMQMPPMVSAVKIKGVPLYKLARKGMEVERKAAADPRLQLSFFQLRRAGRPFSRRLHQGHLRARAGPRIGRETGLRRASGHACAASSPGKFDVKDAVPFEDVLKLSSRDFQKRVIPFLKLAQTSLSAG